MEVVDVLFLITVSVYSPQWFIAAFIGIQIQALPFVCTAFLNHLHPVPQEGGAVARLTVTVQLMFFNPPAKCIVDVAVAFSMVQLFDTHFGQAVFGIVMVILGTAGGLFAAGTSVFVVAVVVVQYDIRQDVCSRTAGLFFGQAAIAVVLKTGIHSALAAQGFPVQVVALDVADNLTVQVNLVQMAGTIIQFVDGTSIRQGGGDAVAQFVILMLQDTLCSGFAQQVAHYEVLCFSIFILANLVRTVGGNFPAIFLT